MPPSPERGISPSPSFSDFGYQAQSPHVSRCFSSSISRPAPDDLEKAGDPTCKPTPSAARQDALHSIAAPSKKAEATQLQRTEAAGESAHSASAAARPWLRTSSLHLDELKQSKPSTSSSSGQDHLARPTSVSPKVFQLQPVPPAKRRRVDDAVAPNAEGSSRGSADGKDELRRCSDAGLALDDEQKVRPTHTELPKGIQAHRSVQDLSSAKETKYAFKHAKAAEPVSNSVTRALGPSHRTDAADSGVTSSKAGSSVEDTEAAAKRSAQIANLASLASVASSRKQHASFSRRMPRLVRAQSVPNLRAKATLDIAAPSHHRLILPSHCASYVSSHARTGREVQNPSSKASATRPSKGFPFNVANYPVGPSNSRSRSKFTPTLHPPITRHTLRELDLFEILKNPQLRHDVVFDPNVQFRPNFDGERGRRKREAGERYWTAVVREIETGCTCTAFSHGQLLPCTCKAKDRVRPTVAPGTQGSATSFSGAAGAILSQSRIPSRIPLLVQELRTICLSILPSNYPADPVLSDADESSGPSTEQTQKANDATVADQATSSADKKASISAASDAAWTTTHHQLIAQTLDPHLISQELQHGVLDVPALITFMGSILKLHCAPMRDEAIEKMVEVVCVDRNIGKGLRLCFEILELMKLDIANHQLRSARPFLVETAVDFEVRWFKEQIEQGKMSLDKTTAWIQQARSTLPSTADASRSEAVLKTFNHGMLQLIFDVPESLPVLSPVATPLGSPSSSSLNNTFASHYPETFQFDAYRMMTFHNDVSDLTIVYMLVLLFRQLCGTPLDDDGALPASVGSLVQRQLKGIKGEIWCLLNDANLCLSSSSTIPPTPTTAHGASSQSRRTGGIDGKLFLASAGGFAKLDHPRWRRAMQNVLLQIAARAAAVQTAARQGSMDPSTVKTAAPSATTQKLLNSWMDTNLRSGSALHKICQSRLRDVVLGMLTDKVRDGLQPSTAALAPALTMANAEMEQLSRPHQKRTSPDEPQDDKTGTSAPAKRLKSDAVPAESDSSSSTSAPTAAPPAASATSPWDAAMSRAGLEPFAAEIRLLSDRIAKVATFHLRVFGTLYEGIESGRHKTGGIQRS